MHGRQSLRFLILVALAAPIAASADTYQVDSIANLQARINGARPGDVIVVRDGVYTTSAPLTIDRQGSKDKPIRIVAKTDGGVTIAGTHGFDVTAPAAYIEIDGFLFTHASGTTQIRPGATHVRFAHNVFERPATAPT